MGIIQAQRFVVTSTATVTNADAMDANDVVATGSFTLPSGMGVQPFKLEQLNYYDAADQTAANLTFVFMDSNVTYGAIDAAPSISDANALSITAQYVMASASILDVTGSKVAVVTPNLFISPSVDGVIYYAIASAGTPTYTTGCITVKLTLSAS